MTKHSSHPKVIISFSARQKPVLKILKAKKQIVNLELSLLYAKMTHNKSTINRFRNIFVNDCKASFQVFAKEAQSIYQSDHLGCTNTGVLMQLQDHMDVWIYISKHENSKTRTHFLFVIIYLKMNMN